MGKNIVRPQSYINSMSGNMPMLRPGMPKRLKPEILVRLAGSKIMIQSMFLAIPVLDG